MSEGRAAGMERGEQGPDSTDGAGRGAGAAPGRGGERGLGAMGVLVGPRASRQGYDPERLERSPVHLWSRCAKSRWGA